MKLSIQTGKRIGWQIGQILPMALVLLAAAVFIIVPGLFAAQIALGVNKDTEQNLRGYYAAEAGIADAMFKFKTGNAPFSAGSAEGSYYVLSSTMNGMNVRVTLLKHSLINNIDNYFIQSSALVGTDNHATIIALIKSGTARNKIFDQAVVSLNGDITMGPGPCRITSDSTKSGNYGNIWANGNISINGGTVGLECKGIASATGTISVSQWNGCVGTSSPNQTEPILYNITISDFTVPAIGGVNYTGLAMSRWKSGGPATYTVGPGFVNKGVTIGGSNTIELTGNLYIQGDLTIIGSAMIKGPYSIITDGDFTVSGGATSMLTEGNIPFIIVQGDSVGILNSTAVAAVIYAPDAVASVSGDTNAIGYNLYGSLIAKSVTISDSTTIQYMTGIYSEAQIPGTQAGNTTLMQYDYR